MDMWQGEQEKQDRIDQGQAANSVDVKNRHTSSRVSKQFLQFVSYISSGISNSNASV
ncbi:hypothetical protein CCACVL1_17249 [Corchorus capsularis]|uniref:Uncharacterized protein n=1 Tax=Corchorus capsularis TaxID=210143 RepID=A0A1R3HST2_COCAP|nr:hypothetical protein CCACVL1_17249 [Corchorus capsularis]